jgi:chemotaxis protein histidine kinase CheA
MTDLTRILSLIGRTRRRLRTQAFVEWATTALVPAVALELVVLWLWRMEIFGDGGALAAALALLAIPLLAGTIGALRRLPTPAVAQRLDRASGLADRLGTACEFAERLAKAPGAEHPETRAMMEAAIADAQNHVDRARPDAAAPWAWPRDVRPAGAFVLVAAIISMLAFRPEAPPDWDALALRDETARQAAAAAARDDRALDPDDLAYSRSYLDELKQIADQTADPTLRKFTEELEALLEKAEKGDISKEELLAEMERLEKQYMEGSQEDLTEQLADMKDAAAELKKEPLTKRLGEALESGDMEAAAKEMERLAEQMEKKELTPEQEKRVAEALEKAAKKQDEKQKAREEKEKKADAARENEIQKKKDEVKRLEKKQKENPKDEQAKKQLEKKKRELEKLERDQQEKKDQQANKKERKLEKLSRDMKQSAENLKNKKSDDAARDMRDAANESKKFEQEMKKVQNQQQAQSKLGDLKDSIRRAKAKNGKDGQGQKGQLGRAQRIKEWEGRAAGGQGDPNAWKQGQGQGQGQGQPGQGRNGQGPPGPGIGNTPDPGSLIGDPTKLSGKKKEEFVNGKDGRGPSKRQTVLTAAQKGFSSVSYKQVYADYKKIVEETMNAEKVPQGYKYYVKRYFQRIKPHDMN